MSWISERFLFIAKWDCRFHMQTWFSLQHDTSKPKVNRARIEPSSFYNNPCSWDRTWSTMTLYQCWPLFQTVRHVVLHIQRGFSDLGWLRATFQASEFLATMAMLLLLRGFGGGEADRTGKC